MAPTEDRLHLAIEVARQAGEGLRAGLGQASVSTKESLEILTQYDLASERIILEAVLGAFPKDAILAEESGARAGGEWTWFVDPLDGTTNFAHGLPIFSVSIAGGRSDGIEFAVIYDPMRDEMFRAQRGGGAHLNDRRLQTSSTSDLGKSLLVTGFPYDLRENPDNNLDRFASLSRRARAVRRLGSAALDLAYVAAGRFDGYWEVRLSPWDMAAGMLLVTEAGGTVSRIDGGADPLRPPTSIVATNGRIHQALLAALERAHPAGPSQDRLD